MLLSIIIPSLNQGSYLAKNLEVLTGQKSPDMEIIVIDGGSTDKTLDVIKHYNSIIDYWVSEKDNGQSHALNKGLSVARGEYIGWQNSDDYYLEDAFHEPIALIRKHVSACNSGERLPIIYANAIIVDEFGKKYNYFYALPYMLEDLLYCFIPITNHSAFIPSKLIRSCGGWDETLHYTMDWDLFIKLGLLNAEFRYYNRIWGAYRIHQSAKLFNLAHGEAPPAFISELDSIRTQYTSQTNKALYRHLPFPLVQLGLKVRRAFYAVRYGHWQKFRIN